MRKTNTTTPKNTNHPPQRQNTAMADQQQQPAAASTTPSAAAAAAASPWTHVLFETSIGRFVIELYYKHTPRTAYNIAALANQGYYDGTIVHRIIRDFVRTVYIPYSVNVLCACHIFLSCCVEWSVDVDR
jgi:Cyclophilin type peptidyl-prolyl cis-trans isomerase/CLD